MKIKALQQLSNMAGKTGLLLKKHSPAILTTAGIVGTVASAVLACKETLKINEILDEKRRTQAAIHTCLEDEEFASDYSEEDGKKDLTKLYVQTGVKIVKLYAPSVILGSVSIASIVMGHKILKKRNVALAAAYTVVDKGFKDYRKNVVDRFGENIDKELRYNIKAKEIETTTKDKNGKDKKGKEVVYEIENPLEGISEFAKFFDCGSDQHRKDPEYNLMFLRRQQDYANDVLRTRGHLFLNEVYDMLDIPRTKAGQVVGWIYDKDNENGDNYVDFGIYDPREANRRFIDGYEYNILLDFNVDGVIYDKI